MYDIYGNVEVDEPAKALPANLSAQDVVKKHIQATGGKAAWKKITDMTLVMQMEMQGMKIDIKTIHKTPNKMMLMLNMMGNSLQKIVFDGTKGYMSQQGQKKDMDAKEVAEYSEEASMHKELDYLNGKYKLALKGIEKVDGSDAYQVEVTKASGDIVTEYFDVNSGLKVRTNETEESEEGKSVSNHFLQRL